MIDGDDGEMHSIAQFKSDIDTLNVTLMRWPPMYFDGFVVPLFPAFPSRAHIPQIHFPSPIFLLRSHK